MKNDGCERTSLLLFLLHTHTHTHIHAYTHTRVYTLCTPENPCEFYSESSWNKSKRTLFIIAGWANVPNATLLFIIHAAAFSEKRLEVERRSTFLRYYRLPRNAETDNGRFWYLYGEREYPLVVLKLLHFHDTGCTMVFFFFYSFTLSDCQFAVKISRSTLYVFTVS